MISAWEIRVFSCPIKKVKKGKNCGGQTRCRQVQHIFESNATSAALAPNIACHKCLARESNPRHLCSNQGILPLDYRDGQNSSWETGLMSCSLRICHHQIMQSTTIISVLLFYLVINVSDQKSLWHVYKHYVTLFYPLHFSVIPSPLSHLVLPDVNHNAKLCCHEYVDMSLQYYFLWWFLAVLFYLALNAKDIVL